MYNRGVFQRAGGLRWSLEAPARGTGMPRLRPVSDLRRRGMRISATDGEPNGWPISETGIPLVDPADQKLFTAWANSTFSAYEAYGRMFTNPRPQRSVRCVFTLAS